MEAREIDVVCDAVMTAIGYETGEANLDQVEFYLANRAATPKSWRKHTGEGNISPVQSEKIVHALTRSLESVVVAEPVKPKRKYPKRKSIMDRGRDFMDAQAFNHEVTTNAQQLHDMKRKASVNNGD